MLQHWTTNYTDVFANLFIYILATFWLSILAATLPVPTGKKIREIDFTKKFREIDFIENFLQGC